MKNNIWNYLIIFLLSIIFIPLITFHLLPNVFGNWDGGYFIAISDSGYTDPIHFAFFPLYPLLIHIVSFIIPNQILSGVVINFVLFIFGIIYFTKLLNLDYSADLKNKIILSLLIFPTSFYFLMVYSESLFFVLTITSFYFARRKSYGLAFILGGLACLTRIVGFATLISILYICWRDKKIKNNWGIILLSIGLALLYPYYLYQAYGNPLLFLSAESHWLRNLSLSNINFLIFLPDIYQKLPGEEGIVELINYLFFIAGLGLLYKVWKQLNKPYFIYSVLLMASILISGNLISTPRLLLVNFPLFIIIGSWRPKRNLLHIPWRIIYTGISIALSIIFYLRFLNGSWIS